MVVASRRDPRRVRCRRQRSWPTVLETAVVSNGGSVAIVDVAVCCSSHATATSAIVARSIRRRSHPGSPVGRRSRRLRRVERRASGQGPGIERIVDGGPVRGLVAPRRVRHARRAVGVEAHGVDQRRRHGQRSDGEAVLGERRRRVGPSTVEGVGRERREHEERLGQVAARDDLSELPGQPIGLARRDGDDAGAPPSGSRPDRATSRRRGARVPHRARPANDPDARRRRPARSC